MRNTIIAIVIGFSLSGCVGAITGITYTPQTIHTAYGAAKVIYSGAKHIVYEVQEEKKRIDSDGFGEKIDSNSTEE